MRFQLLLVAAAFVAVALALPVQERVLAPLHSSGKDVVDGEYIVVMSEQDNGELASVITTTNSTVLFTYEHVFNGVALKASASAIQQIRALNAVKYVETNQMMHASKATDCKLQTDATWGLVRTNERDLRIDGNYQYASNDGEGVDVYIVDTGIYMENKAFEGRAVWGTDTVDTPSPLTDDNGHGTHVAGTVMSGLFGMAKKATAVAVKVLGRNGSGTNAGVIAGVDFVTSAHKSKKGKKPSAANMSLGGGFSAALNAAVDAAVASGVSFAVAAGNENQDACNVSPASAKNCMTVGSSTNEDDRSSFSNYGSCVDIFAPGSDITSTWINGPDSQNTISGTSMASPHVAGQMAKYLSHNPTATPAEVTAALINAGTRNKIADAKTGSPNVLLFGECA